MVFAKETGDSLTSLVKKLDAVVGEHADQQMRAFVNFIGEDREELEESATKFAEGFKNIPIVVPVEFESGPRNYGVNPEAGVTVLIYRGTKVAANHAVAPGKLSEEKITAIIKDTSKILE